jgi:hypothetical protein
LFSAKFFLEKRLKIAISTVHLSPLHLLDRFSLKLYEVKLLVFLRLFNKHDEIKQNSEYM